MTLNFFVKLWWGHTWGAPSVTACLLSLSCRCSRASTPYRRRYRRRALSFFRLSLSFMDRPSGPVSRLLPDISTNTYSWSLRNKYEENKHVQWVTRWSYSYPEFRAPLCGCAGIVFSSPSTGAAGVWTGRYRGTAAEWVSLEWWALLPLLYTRPHVWDSHTFTMKSQGSWNYTQSVHLFCQNTFKHHFYTGLWRSAQNIRSDECYLITSICAYIHTYQLHHSQTVNTEQIQLHLKYIKWKEQLLYMLNEYCCPNRVLVPITTRNQHTFRKLLQVKAHRGRNACCSWEEFLFPY